METGERTILHCDLNNFFASVECLEHPELAGVPVAVGGSVEERHGIVLAKNELAKKFGVRTAETIWQAKQKCPRLVILPPHMKKYVAFSRQIQSIYSEYTDQIEPFGIDECWLDVTGSRMLFGSGRQIAEALRRRIKAETGLTISVGVSFCKVFAKLGSDLKKPDAVSEIRREDFRDIVWPLSADSMLGVGRKCGQQLAKYGIRTIGDIARADPEFLRSLLGKAGPKLFCNACGDSREPVARQDETDEVKSIGNSTTCPADLTSEGEVYAALYRLAESVGARLRRQELLALGVQVSVKDNALATREMQCVLPSPTRIPKELADRGMELIRRGFDWKRPVRAVGLRAFHLIEETQPAQCSLLADETKRAALDELEGRVCALRERYGAEAVCRGSLLDGKKPSEEKK